jgi:hypothetical protein
VKDDVPPSFFVSVDEPSVQGKFGDIMMWAQRRPVLDAAKAKFATGADGWLVAYAAAHGVIVVTNEQAAPDSKREIKLPDVFLLSHFRGSCPARAPARAALQDRPRDHGQVGLWAFPHSQPRAGSAAWSNHDSADRRPRPGETVALTVPRSALGRIATTSAISPNASA